MLGFFASACMENESLPDQAFDLLSQLGSGCNALLRTVGGGRANPIAGGTAETVEATGPSGTTLKSATPRIGTNAWVRPCAFLHPRTSPFGATTRLSHKLEAFLVQVDAATPPIKFQVLLAPAFDTAIIRETIDVAMLSLALLIRFARHVVGRSIPIVRWRLLDVMGRAAETLLNSITDAKCIGRDALVGPNAIGRVQQAQAISFFARAS